MKNKAIYLLAAGHLVTDISQGALPALLPFFISQYGLNYAAAGLLVMAATVSSSVVQPIFGYYADRISKPWFILIGPLLSGLGLALTGWLDNFYLILAAVAMSGLGVAAFHPEGARMANRFAGPKKAAGMSIFSVGGNAGFAVGPLLAVGLVTAWGLPGTLFLVVPGLVIAIVFWGMIRAADQAAAQNVAQLPDSADSDSGIAKTVPTPVLADAWLPFVLLTAAIVCRSLVMSGINTFLPLYWTDYFHQSEAAASTALTLVFSAGIIGNIVGGQLADRFGYRRTVLGGFLLLIPLMLLFVLARTIGPATWLLVPIGLVTFVTFSPMIVMGQQCLPSRVGFASGITIGLAVSVGGFAAPFLGRLADQSGIHAVFLLLTVFPFLAAALVALAPKSRVD